MAYEKKSREYGIILGKKTGSKDLKDPQTFKEMYISVMNTEEDKQYLIKKQRELEDQGFETLKATVTLFGKIEPCNTLELKVIKTCLKPSPEGTLGCDFDI